MGCSSCSRARAARARGKRNRYVPPATATKQITETVPLPPPVSGQQQKITTPPKVEELTAPITRSSSNTEVKMRSKRQRNFRQIPVNKPKDS